MAGKEEIYFMFKTKHIFIFVGGSVFVIKGKELALFLVIWKCPYSTVI